MTEPIEPTRTPAQLADAIRSFTPAQWSRLRLVAVRYCQLCCVAMDADDLLQETFRRALDGERKCPTDVDPVRFLAEAMRSIANGEYSKAGRSPTVIAIELISEPGSTDAEPSEPGPDSEEILEHNTDPAERRRTVIQHFDGDVAAQIIVEGIMEGTRGEDLRALTDLDATAYQSKRRLIARRIDKLKRK